MTQELPFDGAEYVADDADLARRFLKLDHLGEYIAINIYAAQLRFCERRCSELVPVLRDFLQHEVSHLKIFQAELTRRSIVRSRCFQVFGLLGFALGSITAWLGKQAVLACTAAVETVVLGHLNQQLARLRQCGDRAAINAVESIIEDEESHRQLGARGGGAMYRGVYAVVAIGTTCVIRLGMYL